MRMGVESSVCGMNCSDAAPQSVTNPNRRAEIVEPLELFGPIELVARVRARPFLTLRQEPL